MNRQQKRGLVPATRFPEFRGAPKWSQKRFDEVFQRITTKNVEDNQNALTISAQLGLVSQLHYFNKKVAAKNLSGYYLLHKGDFAYNKSYSQGYPMGAIKPLKLYEKGVVSTLYICFRAKKGFNESFFEHYFEAGLLNSEIAKIAQEGGRAHGLLNVSVGEFFSNITLHVPSLEEQQKIADCLNSISDLIDAQTQKLAALKSHKKGLMQQLFPAEGKVIPQLRFPEFKANGAWDAKPLNKLTSYVDYRGKAPPKSDHGIFLVTAKNIKQGNIDYDISKEYVLLDDYDEVMKKGKPIIGDVLLTTEAPLGNVAQIDRENVALAQRVIKFRAGELIDNDFLKHYMLGDTFQNLLKFMAIGSTVQGIQGKVLHKLTIKFPSGLEQKKITDCLNSIDELIKAQTQKVDGLKAHKRGLMQQLFLSAPEVNV
ncbi:MULTISPECIES: restriction endonuclease subunit S [unclassified Duganella]|uniref:restriction endonuclease subunit S n=1 Tax=unclassified Duganella TaxID=2636909 RepID=UPI001E4758C8|nr:MULTISPECIES: restriction endonuclease subunit S [unclassified Duganella]